MPTTIYVCQIEHDKGTNLSVHRTEDEAWAEAAAYAAENWQGEMHGEPMPENPDDARDLYFQTVDGEYVHVDACELAGPEPRIPTPVTDRVAQEFVEEHRERAHKGEVEEIDLLASLATDLLIACRSAYTTAPKSCADSVDIITSALAEWNLHPVDFD
jgi:hypothetical protein